MIIELARRLRFGARSILAYSASIVVFEYLLVVVYQTLDLESIRPILETLPRGLQAMMGTEAERLLSPQGFLTLVFTHPVILVLLSAFPLAFAAGALAGEIERRTITLVLIRPISRREVAWAVVVTMLVGVAVTVLALWGGIALWIRVRHLGPINLRAFAWAAASGVAALWVIGAVAVLASAGTSEAGRASGLGVGFALGSYVANYLANLSPDYAWLARYSLFAYWDPQGVVTRGGLRWGDAAVMLAAAAVVISLAVVVFDRRDIAV